MIVGLPGFFCFSYDDNNGKLLKCTERGAVRPTLIILFTGNPHENLLRTWRLFGIK